MVLRKLQSILLDRGEGGGGGLLWEFLGGDLLLGPWNP